MKHLKLMVKSQPKIYKILKIYILVLLICGKSFAQNISINTTGDTAHTSALLDLKSSNKGFLMPRMSLTERNAITSPAQGLMIYNTSTNSFNYFDGTTWVGINFDCTSAPSTPEAISGSTTVNAGNSGISYSTQASGASRWEWNLPSGWNITSGQGTSSIVATAGSSGGTISVTAINSCGISASQSILVNVNKEIQASGGTITEYVANGTNGTAGIRYRVHTFTSSGTFQVTSLGTSNGQVNYLIVGGGGGGSRGGGGAGGYLEGTTTVSTNTFSITVGNGGNGGVGNGFVVGGNGGNSVAFGLTAVGGGGGGGDDGTAPSRSGSNGGSGGGGSTDGTSITHSGGNGTASQGFNGGTNGGFGSNSPHPSGGGGGAGGAGGNATNSTTPGLGGIGKQSSISGTATYYAGGGEAGIYGQSFTGTGGGNGGGGNGRGSNANGLNATANSGGGGGGSGASKNGGNGGSGIVIIRYPITN